MHPEVDLRYVRGRATCGRALLVDCVLPESLAQHMRRLQRLQGPWTLEPDSNGSTSRCRSIHMLSLAICITDCLSTYLVIPRRLPTFPTSRYVSRQFKLLLLRLDARGLQKEQVG